MNGTFVVRLAGCDDRAAIVGLIAAMGGHDEVAKGADPLRLLGALLATPQARTLVAEIDGAVVGVAALEARRSAGNDRREAWLGLLAVMPHVRSSGIGAALLAAADREAASLGCDVLVVESSQSRERAHAFYRAHGFGDRRPALRFERPVQPHAAALAERFLVLAARAAERVAEAIAGSAALAAIGLGADGAPTEAADDAAERAACSELAPLGIPILSEESGAIGAAVVDPAQAWISLDPLDGSRNFIAGYPAFATSLALVCGGRTVAAFVADLATGRRYAALAGGGATRDGARLTTRRGSLAAVPSALPGRSQLRDFPGISRVRMSGSTVLDLCHVADGALAAFFGLDRAVVHVHDLAAAMLIITEAGGSVLARDGSVPELVPDAALRLDVVAACDDKTARSLLALA